MRDSFTILGGFLFWLTKANWRAVSFEGPFEYGGDSGLNFADDVSQLHFGRQVVTDDDNDVAGLVQWRHAIRRDTPLQILPVTSVDVDEHGRI